ncbi:MAG: PqqD family protein [Devosia sp.]
MQPTDHFLVRDKDVMCEDFDGELVVLDLRSGKYFSLAGGAAIVWRGVVAGHDVTSITAALPAGDARREGVSALLTSLLEHKLLVSAPGHDGAAPAELAAELAASSGPLTLDVFDDLADLLVADPVHDVDLETGWPKLPTEPA